MSKVLSILIAGAFASVSFGALAADNEAKAVRKQADATYKADRKACRALKGQEQKDCMKQAKAKHDQEVGVAKGMKKESKASNGSSSASTGGVFSNYKSGRGNKPAADTK